MAPEEAWRRRHLAKKKEERTRVSELCGQKDARNPHKKVKGYSAIPPKTMMLADAAKKAEPGGTGNQKEITLRNITRAR